MKQALTKVSRWLAIAMAFAIPVSTALDNVLMGALAVTVLAGNARAVVEAIRHNPAARAAILLFAALLIGLTYSAAPLQTGMGILGKYADLALMPLLLIPLRDDATRSRAMLVFMAVMSVTAAVSWLVGLSILPVSSWMWSGCLPDNPAIFRSSITQNMLMAYAVYLLLLRARDAQAVSGRWLSVALALLMAGDVLFMVKGRTGYIVLLALLAVFAWHSVQARLHARGRRLDWRMHVAALLLVPAFLAGVYYAVPRLHARVDEAVAQFRAWQPGVHTDTSIGERLEFYSNTSAIIARHPLIGVGTGAFVAAYEQQAKSQGLPATGNPHNEYLLLLVQLGLFGLILVLYLFYTQWRIAPRLVTPYEQNAARGLVLTLAITSMFNSALLDHTEGIFYAFMSAYWFARLDGGRHHG